MTVIKFDPNRRPRRRKSQREKPLEPYKITDRNRLKLALCFALSALFFQILIYYPQLLDKLPLAFVLLAVLALVMEGIEYFQLMMQKKKGNSQSYKPQ